jgi:hypothetical protein
LAARAASHIALDNPRDVGYLLHTLRAAGADEQAAALTAREPASHVALDNPRDVGYLLHTLRAAGADEQAAALIARMPAEGHLDLFLEQAGHRRKYSFGCEPDGGQAPEWGWDDLDD